MLVGADGESVSHDVGIGGNIGDVAGEATADETGTGAVDAAGAAADGGDGVAGAVIDAGASG